jgi:hypothetical protein
MRTSNRSEEALSGQAQRHRIAETAKPQNRKTAKPQNRKTAKREDVET